jgi:hypothetical protein
LHAPNLVRAARHLAPSVELATQPFVLVALVHLSILAFRLPLLDGLPGWFYELRPKSIGPWYLIVGLAAIPAIGWLVWQRLRNRRFLGVCLLAVLGFAFQQGFAWSEGDGIDGMRRSIVTSGHAEFASIAVQQPSLWDVLTDYEDKLRRDELGSFARSKPPGTLLVYMATERLARPLARDQTPESRLQATRNLASVAWPLICYLALLPLFLVLRHLLGEDAAFVACLFYLVVPSVTLMTLHTDQFLFPVLLMTTVWMAVEAQRRHSWAWAVATGAALYLSAFFTFALLLAVPIAAAFAVAIERQADRPMAGDRAGPLAKTACGAAIGFGALAVLFAVGLHYDLVTRLRESNLHHAQWRNWEGGASETFHYAWLDYLEFAVWLGVPITLLSLAGIRRAVLSGIKGDYGKLVLPAFALLVAFLYLGFFGKTKSEAARLWLPLVPLCCGLAAAELHDRDPSRLGAAAAAVLALQWLTVWLTKASQDFF